MDLFRSFRENTIGYNHLFPSPYGSQKMVYADWTATGRLYRPIERKLRRRFGPFVANTHSETSTGGMVMSRAYRYAATRIKTSLGADDADVLIPCGAGATAAINKLQRILGLRVHERWVKYIPRDEDKPVVFITHMEHHSNQTSWLETIADVVCLPPHPSGLVDPSTLQQYLEKYRNRRLKIGSFTACSNVTGILTPYRQLARIMHEHEGLCFIDFSAGAPYLPINMHPQNKTEKLDAIFLSPHKFLGGPGSCGLLVFDSALYDNLIPDQPGGGTVKWTNPWGGKLYIDDIEIREDGGTPGILQLIRAGLAFQLKSDLLNAGMIQRDEQVVSLMMKLLQRVPQLKLLAGHIKERLAIFSFCFEHLHYNLVVRLLNDCFGIQARGGCSCAGTYGHYLLNITENESKDLMTQVSHENLSNKPGWVRISLHPMMADEELRYIATALYEISLHGQRWSQDYQYDAVTNEFTHRQEVPLDISTWFEDRW